MDTKVNTSFNHYNDFPFQLLYYSPLNRCCSLFCSQQPAIFKVCIYLVTCTNNRSEFIDLTARKARYKHSKMACLQNSNKTCEEVTYAHTKTEYNRQMQAHTLIIAIKLSLKAHNESALCLCLSWKQR